MREITIDQSAVDIIAEQNLIAAMVLNPELLDIARARLVAEDFSHRIHAIAFAEMMAIREDGRSVSAVALARIFGGSSELEPGLTGATYCGHIIDGCTSANPKAFKASIDFLIDRRARRQLAAVGSQLLAVEHGDASVKQTAAAAIEGLDEIRASLRSGARTKFTSDQATAAAIEHWQRDGRDDPVTGIDGLDRMIGGWARGQLTIIAARPGMGKSAIVLSAARRAAKSGSTSLIFSLEMTTAQIGARLLADECFTSSEVPIEYESLTMKTLERTDANLARLSRARQRLESLPITYEEQRGISASEICSRIGRHAADLERDGKRLDTVFVDHIGLVRASKRYAGNRHREVAEITDALATAAKELNIAMVGMCQLNRGVEGRENKRPRLSDLRDSGSIEEDASAVLFLFRPAYYIELEGVQEDAEAEMRRQAMLQATRNTLEIIVAKNRNGRCGSVPQFIEIGANAIRPMNFRS